MGEGWACGLWRSLLLPCLLGHIAASRGPQPQCRTDYATEVVCRWEVGAAVNCSSAFRLRYSKETVPGMSTCIPERGGSASECVCVIPEKHFRRVSFHILLLRADGKQAWNETVSLDQSVKPRRLVNLTVAKGERKRSFLLTWKWDYVASEEFAELSNFYPVFQVSLWPEGQMEKRVIPSSCPTHGKLCHEIFPERADWSSSYVARVRVKNDHFGGHWSEWSAPCKWRNDVPPEPGSDIWPVVLLCAVILALVFTGYACFTRLKKGWWDRIPSPAKSKMAEGMKAKPVPAVRKTRPIHEGRAPLHAACERSRGKSGLAAREEPEPFLTPEVLLVDPPLSICSGLVGKVGGPALHEDAMVSLFLKMLQGGFDVPEQPVGKRSLQTSSESGYRSSSPGATECNQGHGLFLAKAQPNLLGPPESPHTTEGVGQGSTGLVGSSYKCFSSLLCQPQDQQPLPPDAGPSQPPRVVIGPMGPGGRSLLWPASCKGSAAPQDPASQDAPERTGGAFRGPAAPPLSGYRSFSSALENSTASPLNQADQGLTSSYKSFLSVLQGSPKELQEAAGGAWAGLPWEEGPGGSSLGLRVEDGSDKGLFRGEAAEDRGLLCP